MRDDYTGQIEQVNAVLLRQLLDAGYTPVIAPLALSHDGERLNVDGDRAAAAVATALHADALIIMTNVPGLLRNQQDEATLVRSIPADQLADYLGYAHGRMRKKLLGAQEALQGGVPRVCIGSVRCCRPTLNGEGTMIVASQNQVERSLVDATIDLENTYTSGVYSKRPVVIVRGSGALLWDEEGREYIDCAAGHGVANIGHGRAEIAAVLAAQAQRLITCPEIVYNDVRAHLLERLAHLIPGAEDQGGAPDCVA